MKKWVTVEDACIRHVWECPDCSSSPVEIGPDYYQWSGTPVCSECKKDMIYVRTEVRM